MVFKAPDGGAAEHVAMLAQGLTEDGWEIELAGPMDAVVYGRVPASIKAHRLEITGGFGTVGAHVSVLRRLRAILRDGHFDLIHAHSAQAAVLARLVRLAGAPPLVYTAHCFGFLAGIPPTRAKIVLAIERALAPLTTAFIDVSEHERREATALRVGRPERHHVVRNASVACPDVDPDAELLAFRGRSALIVTVTSLRFQKGVDVFLRALPRVFDELPDVRAAVVGNGPEGPSLSALADQLGLGESRRLLMIPFEGPSARYLRCADIYVLASRWEGLPIGALEAMACGVPQVVSDVDEEEGVVPDTGMIVPSDDPAALANSLVELARDHDRRRRMSEASRARHAALFTPSRMVAETIAVYESVTSAGLPVRAAGAPIGARAQSS
jgi:glycosyltransferase involved in cell wall biosynthesis